MRHRHKAKTKRQGFYVILLDGESLDVGVRGNLREALGYYEEGWRLAGMFGVRGRRKVYKLCDRLNRQFPRLKYFQVQSMNSPRKAWCVKANARKEG